MIFSQEYNLINFKGHQRLRKKLNLGCLQNLKKIVRLRITSIIEVTQLPVDLKKNVYILSQACKDVGFLAHPIKCE